jgi:hypothetical protein
MKKLSIFILILLPIFISCRKEEVDKIDGPKLNDVFGQFSVITDLDVSLDSVDFSTGQTVHFTAELSKIVDWKLTITGQTSGGVKIIEGTSSTIDAAVSTWLGDVTEFPIFKAEICDVALSFTGESDTLDAQVKIIQPKTNVGFLLSDFESGLNPGWSSFIQSGANMDFQIKTDAFAPQGNSYYNMAGTVNWDWLIGYVYMNASAYGNTHFPLSPNPDETYFNIMVYGEPGMINTLILFQFQEDDDNNGSFNANTEDMYSLEVKVDWAGWKLISVKYSDIPCLVNGQPSTPNGNGVHNSDKIKQLNILDLANPISGPAKTKIDYIIFTENDPLKP